jgi:phosphoribosylformylglycinamidine cyclo-ligase
MVLSYAATGVDSEGVETALQTLGKLVTGTFSFNAAKPLLPLGYFANVLQISPELGLAISTDGVGTKILIAQALDKYDTVGIDCVAMNANDILCVGARPVSMVDYIAVQRAEPRLLEELAKGLCAGARQASINIPGGEIAQVREMLQGCRDGYGFDLVGTCVGTVHPKRILIGQQVEPGDQVVGLASSGLHSNGFTLARRALFEVGRLQLNDRAPELGRSVGEELLEPTRIYVEPILRMLDAGLRIKACIHVTGDGLLNLTRVAANVGFVIDSMPEAPPIFRLIQRLGNVESAEMMRVFNMGIGFCVVVDPTDAGRVRSMATESGHSASVIGYAFADPQRRIWLPQYQLVGAGKTFRSDSTPPPPNTAPRLRG